MYKLKPLLLKIANLPLKDQRWLLRQLTPQQRTLFVRNQGPSLLKTARRFAKVPLANGNVQQPKLPELCQDLNTHSPLYSAIILDQGHFRWKKAFIAQRELSLPEVHHIKPGTKAALFRHWSEQFSFEDHLEVSDGSDH